MKRDVMLSAKNITKIYNYGSVNPFVALDGISLELYSGEFLCVMGPSGSGKSTLVNNLSTIDTPEKGEVYIAGEALNVMSEKERSQYRYHNLGFIFQDDCLISSISIYENIAVPLYLKTDVSNDIKSNVMKAAELLGITDILEKFPSECSGGQRQRAAICRALIARPKLLIADEPTGNLDCKNSHEILSIFKRLNKEESMAIIMVTHDAEIASYSDTMIYLKDGKIENKVTRGNKSQKEYFHEIVQLTTEEAQGLFKD